MSDSLISVIVPVYNSEQTLHRCIDSILGQTYRNFELLLINDGSKDCSGEICDEYARKDNRVKVFHKPFGVFVNLERGLSRIESLLQPLDLMDRCIIDAPVDLDKPIDWNLIDNILLQKAESSMTFLKQALNIK